MPTPPKQRKSTRVPINPARYRESPPRDREAKKPRVSAGEDISARQVAPALELSHGRTCLYVYMYINHMYNIYLYLYAYVIEYILYTLIYLLYNTCSAACAPECVGVSRSPEWTVSTVKTSSCCGLRLCCQAPPCSLLCVQCRRRLRLV
jgi:hypothetical protein